MKKLTEYNFPEDLKSMDLDQLEILSYGIRDFLINSVAKTGGHLASNLGVVELTIALHTVFDSPKDKIIWDVGHQCYVHKILTGRINQFDGLRKLNGMSGFPKIKESEHDVYETGHSSTSISAACGMAVARDLKGEHNEVIAVIGDGSLTGGMAYEALNNIGHLGSKVIVILNDNGMSISPNIGGVSEYLAKVRTSSEYLRAKKAVKQTIQKIPGIGEDLSTSIGHAKERIKYAMLSGGVLLEEFGFKYLGPIDGHNLEETIAVLERAKNVDGPVFIHLITKKGKGYRNAENDPGKFHGIGAFNPETGALLKPASTTYSEVFGKSALALADKDDKVVTISAAMCEATGLGPFSKKYPERFFDVGIAEAHAVTFCAGLARCDMKPIAAIYSSFLQRGYDQLIEDVCLQNLHVVFAIDRAGLVGADGETHHGVFDLSYLPPMPNMKVLTPSSGEQLFAMLDYAVNELDGPVAVRYPRGNCTCDKEEIVPYDGKNIRISSGSDVDIWAVGKMLDTAEKVRTLLTKRGIQAGIVDVTTVKPMDLSCLNKNIRLVVTLEDNVLLGGFGERFRTDTGMSNVISFGWPDKFVEHGDCDSLFERYGLDAESITERICEELERKA